MRDKFQERSAPVPGAARLLVGQISPGPVQAAAAMAVLQKWAGHDFAGATASAEPFPPGDLADRAIDELAGLANYQANHPVSEPMAGLH